MMVTMMRRLRREEEGYSLVIAMLLLAIMAVLLVVGLDAGTASLKQSSLAIEWSKALTVAEAGLNDSITRLGESRSATNPCNMSTSTVCTGGGGQYQVSWTQTGSKIVVTSVGYYPTKTSPTFTREVQATYEPAPRSRATSIRTARSPLARTPRSAAASFPPPVASRSRTGARSSSPIRLLAAPGRRGRSGPAVPPGSSGPNRSSSRVTPSPGRRRRRRAAPSRATTRSRSAAAARIRSRAPRGRAA